ncbi:hypothetical protein [Rodentibacter pneumotropicus]|uniref:hypothetical protein n=1 Tax=Rodentibacter pneumotropicus TaxID=758 RepID=UPI0009870CE9|nr:hypothetical protein [Rodentibacter pneumotropicus]OOF65224.1 hypothetical protein BKL50_00170 [Rodentibacter pneumotropicus]THA18347.1 hypothetical protein D3M83_05780 [Rodentibacter pneumotropicus]
MSSVKMTFIVEIDGKTIIQHQIEEQSEKRSYFSQERKLTKEIVDKMNEFHSERWIDAKPWDNFKVNEKQ